MKLYRNQHNTIYAYEEDGSQDHLIGDKIPITQAEADTIIQTNQLTDFNNLNYAEKRRMNYPSIGDQLDALYHAGVFPAEMAEKLRIIKETYPKS